MRRYLAFPLSRNQNSEATCVFCDQPGCDLGYWVHATYPDGESKGVAAWGGVHTACAEQNARAGTVVLCHDLPTEAA